MYKLKHKSWHGTFNTLLNQSAIRFFAGRVLIGCHCEVFSNLLYSHQFIDVVVQPSRWAVNHSNYWFRELDFIHSRWVIKITTKRLFWYVSKWKRKCPCVIKWHKTNGCISEVAKFGSLPVLYICSLLLLYVTTSRQTG